MKKKILVLLLSCFICVFLSACDYKEMEREDTKDNSSMFVLIEENMAFNVVYHKETRVMYVVSCSSYNDGNFTMLVNADGTPMIYPQK